MSGQDEDASETAKGAGRDEEVTFANGQRLRRPFCLLLSDLTGDGYPPYSSVRCTTNCERCRMPPPFK